MKGFCKFLWQNGGRDLAAHTVANACVAVATEVREFDLGAFNKRWAEWLDRKEEERRERTTATQ